MKIIDFGISKFQNVGGDEAKTRTGMIIGTPLYMSPEQARGLSEADARADLYAVGVMLYESVTGRVPFTGASPTDLLFQIALSTPPPIPSLVNDVDPAFCSIVEKAMARDPGHRFQTGAEFIAALDAWAQRGVGVTGPVAVPTQVLPGRHVGGPTGMMSPFARRRRRPWEARRGAGSQMSSMPPKRRAGLVFALVGAWESSPLAAVVAVLALRGRGVPGHRRVLRRSPPRRRARWPPPPPPPPPVASTETVTLAPPLSAPAAPSAVASAPRPSQPAAASPAPRRAPAAAPASANNGAYNPFGHL